MPHLEFLNRQWKVAGDELSSRYSYDKSYQLVNSKNNCCESDSPNDTHNESRDDYSDNYNDDNDWLNGQSLWEKRCKILCKSVQICSCNLFGGNNIQDSFEEVARIFTKVFHHDGFLDVVPSDVVAGIILVRHEQKANYNLNVEELRANQPYHSRFATSVEEESITKFDLLMPILHNNPISNVKYDHSDSLISNSLNSKSTSNCLDNTINNSNTNNHNNIINRNDNTYSIRDLHRNITFSLAMYSHMIYVFMKPISGTCKLCGNISVKHTAGCLCASCCYSNKSDDKDNLVVKNDNFCNLHQHGLSNIIEENLNNAELVYASFNNNTIEKPYAVFLDHDNEKLVIAIRGTLSLEDCVTDVIVEPMELTSVGMEWGFDGTDRWAHCGMLKSAVNIRKELNKSQILQKLLSPTSFSTDSITSPLKTTGHFYSNYQLVITGHSLGAGIASLLALTLRNEFPNVNCCVFGTPATVLDRKSSIEFSSFITTVVLDSDMISRMSVNSLCGIRNDILDSISRAKVNKMQIFRSLYNNNSSSIIVEQLLCPKGQEPDSTFKRNIDKFKNNISSRFETPTNIGLFIPGRIIHLIKTNTTDDSKHNSRSCCCTSSTCKKNRVYVAKEACLDDFLEIMMSSSMGIDHFPDQYFHVINRIYNRTIDENSTSESANRCSKRKECMEYIVDSLYNSKSLVLSHSRWIYHRWWDHQITSNNSKHGLGILPLNVKRSKKSLTEIA
eukprot:gene9971-13411_t